jgi:hypothetical protein
MSKMGSHCSFGHLKHKLWAKEGPGVELSGVCPGSRTPGSLSRESNPRESISGVEPPGVYLGSRTPGSLSWESASFDSRPLKVENWPEILSCRWRATYRWIALDESYNFALDCTSIRGLLAKLWGFKVPEVPLGGISGLPRGSPEREKSFGCGPRGASQRIL